MNKEGKIELYRFLACLFIMMGHYLYYVLPNLELPFVVSYQFVEFFFMVTGYFTARHFDLKWQEGSGAKEVLKYHFKKFLRFMPYTIPAIIGVYAVESYTFISADNIQGLWDNLKDIVLEVLFLSVFRPSGAHLFVMWFLSAMFITLPVLIAFCFLKRKWVKIIPGTILPVIYYVLTPDYTSQNPVNQLLRAFMGMLMGATIYYLSCYIKELNVPKAVKWICTILFTVAYIAPIIICYRNMFLSYEYIICFVVWMMILMSDLTVMKPWHSRIMGYLGDISMPVFMWHIAVFKFVSVFNVLSDNEILRITVSFAMVFFICIINMAIVKLCKKYIKKA